MGEKKAYVGFVDLGDFSSKLKRETFKFGILCLNDDRSSLTKIEKLLDNRKVAWIIERLLE